jgi:AcrR family transcriptional regulator
VLGSGQPLPTIVGHCVRNIDYTGSDTVSDSMIRKRGVGCAFEGEGIGGVAVKKASSSPARRAHVELQAIIALRELLAAGTPLAEIPVDAIAARAGISRSTFYLYFADKGALLAQAAIWLKDQLFEARIDPQIDGSLDDLDSYVASLERIICRYREHAALLAAVIHAARFDDRVAQQWLAAQNSYISWVSGILRELQERGLTDPSFDADEAAEILISGGEHVIGTHVSRRSADHDRVLARELGAAQWFGFFHRSGK